MRRGRGWDGLFELAGRNLAVVGVAFAVFFFLLPGANRPLGWGAAYAFGASTAVEIHSSCEIETLVRGGSVGRSTGKCEGATWTVDGRTRRGTLYASSDEIDRTSAGDPKFVGEAKAFGSRVYGRPGTSVIVLDLTLVTAAGTGVLVLLGCVVAAALSFRRPREADTSETADSTIPGRVFIAELVLIALAAGAFAIFAGWL
ncbi:hypothetical protein LUW76_05665 [Actinomadura madurae]|uniref:hypothetical protein n=1 Tax=Actinomadura madurae TaxID=1993 RepID=UPI002026E7EE|nr:hypothetical protein [Actinomadura madurae]MCP9964954.1 hypothetical protein [Actinomadura madurae]URM93848.1 hypothetical protein LUW76_05665 [Actinomadura madurae]URN04570.1 hypothetical protein LUW74_15450 [Actinomadura madurae]